MDFKFSVFGRLNYGPHGLTHLQDTHSRRFKLVVYFIAKSCYFCEENLPFVASNKVVIVKPQVVTFSCFLFDLDVKWLKWTLNFFSHELSNPDKRFYAWHKVFSTIYLSTTSVNHTINFAAITTLSKTTHNSTFNTPTENLSLSPHKSSHGTFLDSNSRFIQDPGCKPEVENETWSRRLSKQFLTKSLAWSEISINLPEWISLLEPSL